MTSIRRSVHDYHGGYRPSDKASKEDIPHILHFAYHQVKPKLECKAKRRRTENDIGAESWTKDTLSRRQALIESERFLPF